MSAGEDEPAPEEDLDPPTEEGALTPPPEGDPAETPAEPRRWLEDHPVLVVGVGILVVVAGGLWILSGPTGTGEEPIEASEQNTELYGKLAASGIQDALVDVTEERALIRYNQPANMTRSSSVHIAMGSAAQVAPNSSEIVVEVYEDFEPAVTATVTTDDVLAFLDGEITYETFRDRVRWETAE